MLDRMKRKEIQTEDFNKLRKSFSEVFAGEAGENALKHIKNMCGYDKSSIVIDTRSGEINDRATLFNEARRVVYLEIRRFVDSEILKKVEY